MVGLPLNVGGVGVEETVKRRGRGLVLCWIEIGICGGEKPELRRSKSQSRWDRRKNLIFRNN